MNRRLQAAQLAWDYAAPPEYGDMQVCENGCEMIFASTGPVDPNNYWIADLYVCENHDCENYEVKNRRKNNGDKL